MRIFIASSSKEEIDNKFLRETKRICNLLKEETLVFGLADKSMMGECYFLFNDIIGITTLKYKNDIHRLDKSYNYLVKNSIERINKINDLYDIALILPGGIGTLSELFSLVEEKRDSLNNKKIIIYNYDGFYDKLVDFLKYLRDNKFINDIDYEQFIIINNIADLKGEIYGK